MQINIRIGAGAVVVVVLLLAIAAWPQLRALLPGLGLTTGTATTSVSGLREPLVMRTEGGLLEIARVKAYERFERKDPKVLAVIDLDLGTTVSELEVAALFRYQIEMARRWPIDCTPQRCVVRTGPVKLATPVATYSEETRKRTRSGWARFNKDDNLARLEQGLSSQLAARGEDPRNRKLALEAGRKTVQEFVRAWLKRETGRVRDVLVLYPGEVETAPAPPAAAASGSPG